MYSGRAAYLLVQQIVRDSLGFAFKLDVFHIYFSRFTYWSADYVGGFSGLARIAEVKVVVPRDCNARRGNHDGPDRHVYQRAAGSQSGFMQDHLDIKPVKNC